MPDFVADFFGDDEVVVTGAALVDCAFGAAAGRVAAGAGIDVDAFFSVTGFCCASVGTVSATAAVAATKRLLIFIEATFMSWLGCPVAATRFDRRQ